MNSNFPKYSDKEPLVPVRCVTPDRPGCIHRFFDTSPISPSGKYLAVFQMPFENRQPQPGEKGSICIVNLETGESAAVARSCGWEPQMGANINWGATDRQLFFNDVDTEDWTPFAWELDPLSGKKKRLEGTVYHASPDGRWVVSANMATMRKTQAGYGVVVPKETAPQNKGLREDDGFFLTDTITGKKKLLVSIKDLFTRPSPPVEIDHPDLHEVYCFHCKFNPGGDRLMLSLRWFKTSDEPVWEAFEIKDLKVRFAWVTMSVEGGDMHCAVGPGQWDKGGHHATWFPNGKQISMNLNIDREKMRLVQVDANGMNLKKMHPDVVGSGHPTLHPNGRHILTDSYIHEKTAFDDGTVPLRWIDLSTGREKTLVRIRTKTPYQEHDSALRVDPHPAWDRNWRYVTFNAFTDGTRRVFVADMADLL